jgi:hypothetical protein
VAALWMMGQCGVFLRNRERLGEPPIGLVLDESSVEWLSRLISAWIVGGLKGGA